ncbi:hypothetical protein C8R44DRAFT_613217, partial [Mycena epipterygia]
NPRVNTPWQVLHASGSDRAFITTMGFDVQIFAAIIDAGFGDGWYATPIPRNDVPSTGKPRPGTWSLDAVGALGFVLHYLNSINTAISFTPLPKRVILYSREGTPRIDLECTLVY